MKQPIIVLGGGGHSKVLMEVLRMHSEKVLGICSLTPDQMDPALADLWIGNDEVVLQHHKDSILLVNGLGSISMPSKRKDIFDYFEKNGYHFSSVIHPSAIIAKDVQLSEGVQIMAGAIIQPGSRIGKNTIINTKTSVDHDSIIGDHVHLAPGVTVCGGVNVDNEVHIGSGATVIQGVHIGGGTVIGAGALVLHDVPKNSKAIGIPVKVIEK